MCRKPKFKNPPLANRVTKYDERPELNAPVAWNFKRMDSGGKFKCSLKLLHDHVAELVKLEGKSKETLMGGAHNHPMSVDKLSPVAKARIDTLNLDMETIYQLNLKTPARLWGIFEYNIFHVIWLDKDHEVYPCS